VRLSTPAIFFAALEGPWGRAEKRITEIERFLVDQPIFEIGGCVNVVSPWPPPQHSASSVFTDASNGRVSLTEARAIRYRTQKKSKVNHDC
jgi:hypothetical protein